jgi:hypothetical protein
MRTLTRRRKPLPLSRIKRTRVRARAALLRRTRGGHPFTSNTEIKTKTHIKLVSALSPNEQQQIDNLIKNAFENAGLSQVELTNVCIFITLQTEIVSVMFLKMVPEQLPESSKRRVYIHTVSVSEKHRGMGLLHKMLSFAGRISRFKDAVFELTAANTVDHGLNQASRFQIYSKSGFLLPYGTVVEPSGYKVLNVDANTKPQKSIVYTMQDSRTGKKIQVSYQDLHPTGCSINNIKQERGCTMKSDSKKLRDFNTK